MTQEQFHALELWINATASAWAKAPDADSAFVAELRRDAAKALFVADDTGSEPASTGTRPNPSHTEPGKAGEWVMVPREPTEAMLKAWWRAHFSEAAEHLTDADAYAAMLNASPPPPVGETK